MEKLLIQGLVGKFENSNNTPQRSHKSQTSNTDACLNCLENLKNRFAQYCRSAGYPIRHMVMKCQIV
jgi:hypothetical protein